VKKESFHVTLLSTSEKTISDLKKCFSDRSLDHCRLDQCLLQITMEDLLLQYTPDLIMVDLANLPPEELESLMQGLQRIADKIPLVAVIREEQKAAAVDYVKQGFRDFINLPVEKSAVLDCISRFDLSAEKPKELPGTKAKGKLYTFFCTKGGVGNTFISLNTAVSLARISRKKVLLWDMSLQSSDIPFFLNEDPKYTLHDLIENLSHIDKNYLDSLFQPHPSGVYILPAPDKIDEIDKILPEQIDKMLQIFTNYFDHIVVDGGHKLTDILIPLLDISAYIFMPTTMEIISMRSASRCLEILEKLGYSQNKIRVIINRHGARHEDIQKQQIKEVIRHEPVLYLPNDYATAKRSVKYGEPISMIAKKSGLNHDFDYFASRILTNFQSGKGKKKRFFIF